MFQKASETTPNNNNNNNNNKRRPRIIILSFASGQGRAGGEGHPSNPQARPHEGRLPIFVDPLFNMSANDKAGSKRKRLRLDNDPANFVYTGQENVPKGVIHVRVHPSIRVIRARAFL